MEFKTVSAIRGHHIYKSIWGPETGEILSTKKERNNPHDRFAVAVMKDKLTVGHIPREISKICWFFLHKGGTIYKEKTGGGRLHKGGRLLGTLRYITYILHHSVTVYLGYTVLMRPNRSKQSDQCTYTM